MVPSLGLTIVGLAFIIITAIFSLTKKKYNNIENNIYRFLLLITFILLSLEVICVFTMSKRDIYPVLNELLCRTFILGCIIWFTTLVCYISSLGETHAYTRTLDLFNNVFMKIWVFVGLILFVISCFLDIEYTSGNGLFYVISGPAVYSLYAAFAFEGVYMIYMLFIKRNNSSFFKRLPVILFLVFYAIAGLIQLVTQTDFNDLSYVFVICVVFMYFTLENQDLKKINELEEAKKNAEIADKEKTDFLLKMSHEIRTPMNAIIGFTEAIINSKEIDRQQVKTDIGNVHTAAENLLEMINNILNISRIESGKEVYDEQEYSIKDIIYEVISLSESKINKEKVNFVVEIDENIPSLLKGDKVKINEIINNLVSNSVKYTKVGEISFIIDSDIKEDTVTLNIQVKDTGIGIREEDYERLFEKFSKLSTNTETEIQGTGLGLIVTKKLVDIVNGTMTFESTYGVGTTFKVCIDQKIVDYSSIGKIDFTANKNSKYFDCSNYSVLIVDDNNLNLKVATKLLEPYKFKKIDLVKSGNECIELIKSNNEYDLILLDHMMPGMNGIETFKVIKQINNNEKTKIVAMTANAVSEDKKLYDDTGFDGYLAKPIDSRLLNKLLKTILNK